MRALLLLFFLITLNAYADISCSENEDRDAVSLKTGTHPNSLQNMRVQDQDGLGTCYANTLSLMLEGTLEDRPQLSYQQIAIINGLAESSRTRADGLGRNLAYKADGRSIITEFGNACRAFNYVRNAGSQLCRRSDVPIEDQVHGNDQGALFESMSTLYDSVTNSLGRLSTDGSRQVWLASFRVALTNAAVIADVDGITSCRRPINDPPLEAINRKLTDYCVGLADRLTSMQGKLDMTAASDTDRRRDFSERIETMVTELEKYGYESDGTEYTCRLKDDIKTKMRNVYWPHMEATNGALARDSLNFFLTSAGLDSAAFNSVDGTLSAARARNLLKRDVEVADPTTCRRALQWRNLRDATFLRSRLGDQFSCLADTVASTMGLLGRSNARRVPLADSIMALTRIDQPLQQFMMGVVGPNCMENAVTIPDSLSCNTVDFPRIPNALGNTAAGDPSTWSNEPNKTQILNTSQNRLRSEVEAAFANNRPLGFLTCTSYLRDNNDQTNDSNYSRNCNASGSHAMHLMTVVGQRCKDGVLEYQIQNSWGTGCNFVVGGSGPTRQYECDDGAFWVPESTVARNIRETYSLTGAASSSSP